MAAADPYLIDTGILPPPVPESWLSGPIQRENIERDTALREAQEIIAECESHLRGSRERPSLFRMVDPQSGEITVALAEAEALRARGGELGRSRDSSSRNARTYRLVACFFQIGKPLPAVILEAVAHTMGLIPSLRRRERAEKVVQHSARLVAEGHPVPASSYLAKLMGVSDREIQQLRRFPSTKSRQAQMDAFFTRHLLRIYEVSGDSDPQLTDRFIDEVSNEWDTFDHDTVRRAVAAFIGGNARQKAVARMVLYRMIHREAREGLVTSESLVNALRFALGIEGRHGIYPAGE